MPVRDGRPLRETFDLETHGFEFVDHPTKMVDFFDEAELKSVYYTEVEELVKQRTGCLPRTCVRSYAAVGRRRFPE